MAKKRNCVEIFWEIITPNELILPFPIHIINRMDVANEANGKMKISSRKNSHNVHIQVFLKE
jgi:hypothetical protein